MHVSIKGYLHSEIKTVLIALAVLSAFLAVSAELNFPASEWKAYSAYSSNDILNSVAKAPIRYSIGSNTGFWFTGVLPEYPVIVSNVMRDSDADFVPDLLSIRLSDTFKTDQRLDSIRIAYKGLLITVPGSSVTIQGTQLDVPVSSGVGIDGRPTGNTTIFMTVDGEVKSHSQTFNDGVCPAIIAADVLESDGMSPDILFLTFSEPLIVNSILGRQVLIIPQGTTDTVALTITQMLGQANDSTFSVQTASSDRKAISGDRLRLIPGSIGGTLTDKNSNKPHDLNRSVVIGFRPGAAAIVAAWYLDLNADGILDNVAVKFKRKVEQAEVDYARIFRDQKQFSVPFSRCARLGDSTYRIPIGDTLALLDDINTQGAMDLLIIYKALPDIPRVARVADSAAPVLKTARLIPGARTQAEMRGKDTLIADFSEGVVPPGQTPFLLSTKEGGLLYAFMLTYVGTAAGLNSYRFIIESFNIPSVPNAMAGDTIWINPSAGVSDSLLNPQSNPKNRRVLLQVGCLRAEWHVQPKIIRQNYQVIGTIDLLGRCIVEKLFLSRSSSVRLTAIRTSNGVVVQKLLITR
jgi:hypothetical protein